MVLVEGNFVRIGLYSVTYMYRVSPQKVSFLFYCCTEAIIAKALKLGPHIKNTWEFVDSLNHVNILKTLSSVAF